MRGRLGGCERHLEADCGLVVVGWDLVHLLVVEHDYNPFFRLLRYLGLWLLARLGLARANFYFL